MGPSFVELLTVERFHGVGPATAAKMNRLGIFTALDLRAKDQAFLQQHFGKAGPHFYWISRASIHRPVRADRVRKSVGAETTFARDLTSLDEMRARVGAAGRRCGAIARGRAPRARTVTLKVKFADFQIITRSRSTVAPIADASMLVSISAELLAAQFPLPKGVRLLGVSLSSLATDEASDERQMTLKL